MIIDYYTICHYVYGLIMIIYNSDITIELIINKAHDIWTDSLEISKFRDRFINIRKYLNIRIIYSHIQMFDKDDKKKNKK